MGTTIELRRQELKKYRALAGLDTDTALAAKMGVDRATVGRMLKPGATISLSVIGKLVDAFRPALEFPDLFEVITTNDDDEDHPEVDVAS